MFVELNRQFISLSEEEVSCDEIETQIAYGLSEGNSWKNLLKEHRIVILSSAGSGKTEEIKNTCAKLRKEEIPAFFLRLEFLGKNWKTAFEFGSHTGLETTNARQKECWIFLDSIDEARLSGPKDFERAIRQLSSKMGGNLQNAHIFITSRIGAWRPKTDVEMVQKLLPFKPSEKPPESTENIENDDLGDAPVALQISNRNGFSFYTLHSLTTDQIQTYSSAHGVSDTKKLIEEIDRNDVWNLAGRPKDLDDIIDFWKVHGRLGSRLELVEENVRRKLAESDPNRAASDPLTVSKALSGAKRLAAAVSTTRRTRIIVPDSTNPNSGGLKIEDVLSDWTTQECSALLSRPIFEPETYGFVRFHHRDSLEYLAAKWFNDLLSTGNSRRSVEGLFFTSQYGIEVVIPKMRSLLPWLALFDLKILERLIAHWPEVLFEGGDPSKLPLTSRELLMRNICSRFAAKQTAGISVDFNVLQRLVGKDMTKVVRELFEKYSVIPEIRRLLLRSIELGQIKGCVEFAESFALNPGSDRYTRAAAMRALVTVGSSNIIQNTVKKNIPEPWLTDRSHLSDFMGVFGPKYLPAPIVLDLVSRVNEPHANQYQGLNNSLSAYLKHCPIEYAVDILNGTASLLKDKPFYQHRHFEASEKNIWMLGYACDGYERLISERHSFVLTPPALSTISLIGQSRDYDGRHDKKQLAELVADWPDLNLALFWYNVCEQRRLLDNKKDNPLTDWWQARIFSNLWSFTSSDFQNILKCIDSRELSDDKLVALSLAFRLYLDNSRPANWRTKLKKAAKVSNILEEKLHKLFHPPALTTEEKRYRRREAGYNQRQKQRAEKEAKNKADWKRDLPSRIDEINGSKPAPEGMIWNSQAYLFERMRKLGKDQSRWAYSNWRDLIDDQCQEVAEAMRDGLINTWRTYQPTLASELGGFSNSTDWLEIFSLSGLEIDAHETEDWPKSLSDEDAQWASRYIFSELNGFCVFRGIRLFIPTTSGTLFRSIRHPADVPHVSLCA